MKKLSVIFILIIVMGGIIAFGISNFTSTNSEILRIHIRANSNEHIDQSVKYQVKDAVVSAMLPILSDCKSKVEAEEKMQEAGYKVVAYSKDDAEGRLSAPP